MRRWMGRAVLLLALLLAPQAWGASQGRPFEAVPAGHWAYGKVQRLERSGYFTGYPEKTFSGARKLTRYEFAAAVERMYQGLQPRVLAASAPEPLAGASPESLRKNLADFRALLSEFGAEVAGLGHDLAEINRQMRAMEQRRVRLQSTVVVPEPQLPDSSTLSSSPIGERRKYGVRNAFGGSSPGDPLAMTERPEYLRPPTGPVTSSGAGAAVGSARLDFQTERPDQQSGRALFPRDDQDPTAIVSYRAQLSLPVGRHLVKAYYNRHGRDSDPYALWNPYAPAAAAAGVGGAFSGTLSQRLAFELETANLEVDDELARRMFLFKSSLNYAIGAGFNVGLGYEWTRRYGAAGSPLDFSTYTVGVGRQLGSNARFDFIYRHFNSDRSLGATGVGRSIGDSGAIGQVTVRF